MKRVYRNMQEASTENVIKDSTISLTQKNALVAPEQK
jgi:hypothetical protein